MPPVLGPRSSSSSRLKSCAGASVSARSPSQSAKSETSRPSRSSSTTTRPPSASARGSAAASSASVSQTKTPFPAARPSALTTQGACGSASSSAVGTPAAWRTSFANDFEPSIRAASALGPKTGDAGIPELVGEARDQRSFGPDDDEVDCEPPAERHERLVIVRANAVAGAERGDARISRGRVELAEPSALRELPGERVLSAAAADDEDVHEASLIGPPGIRPARRSRHTSSRSRDVASPMGALFLVTVAAEGGQRPAPPRARVYLFHASTPCVPRVHAVFRSTAAGALPRRCADPERLR